jgi:hypothetical protein
MGNISDSLLWTYHWRLFLGLNFESTLFICSFFSFFLLISVVENIVHIHDLVYFIF